MGSKKSLAVAFVAAQFLFIAGCGKAPEEKSQAGFRVEQESAEEAHARKQPEAAGPQAKFKSFKVYTDANSPDNHYAPSGWMGDWGDIKLNQAYMENPHGGTTSVQVIYN